MKVGYILKKFPRLSETFILNEVLALEERGVEVEIFSLKRPDDEPRHSGLDRLKAIVTVIDDLEHGSVFKQLEALSRSDLVADHHLFARTIRRLDPTKPWRIDALRYALPILSFVEERGIQHLHSHFATIATAAAHEVAALSGLPFSFTMHAKDIYRETVSFENLSEWLHNSSFAVTVCEANRRWIIERCKGGASDQVRVLYNGIDLEQWIPSARNRRTARVLGVGRLVEKKGFDDFLRACSLLRKRGLDFQPILIGSGEMESELRTLATSLDLHDFLEFHGPLPQDQVRFLMQESAVLVAPCIEGADGNRDALPTVLLEAMALGVPCVSTPIGGIPEIVRTSEEGWIVPSRDPHELAQAIEEALTNPEATAQKGIHARKRIENDFNLRKNNATLASWFEESIRRTPSVGMEPVSMGGRG